MLLHTFDLQTIEDTLADAADATQQHTARAGGTATIWVETPTGLILCVTDGDGGEPFSPWGNQVEAGSFAIGLYRNEGTYLDGGTYESLDIVPADPNLTALTAKVKDLIATHN